MSTRQDTVEHPRDLLQKLKYIGQRNLPFYIGVDKQEFLIYNTHRNGNPAPNSVLLMKRKCVPFLFLYIKGIWGTDSLFLLHCKFMKNN